MTPDTQPDLQPAAYLDVFAVEAPFIPYLYKKGVFTRTIKTTTIIMIHKV